MHHLPISWRLKKSHLLLASYLFYAAWNPPFVLLLLLSTFWDWQVAQKIHQSEEVNKRRRWLFVSLFLNLGMLVVFKYAGFLLENFNTLILNLGVQWQVSDPGLILPMGISFYTFQTLSYTLDIYFKRLKPWHSFLDYALYVSFFPQLVAGPIVRAIDFLPQTLKQVRVSVDQFSTGVALFLIGLFQKTVMADAWFAPVVDQVFNQSAQASSTDAWLGSLFFTGQIFCDFSGYSLCAIGVAMCLGFNLPVNFKAPFAAVGFSDFWRRWHISLSSWLRDYLYIPLGGNRHGFWSTGKNLMFTMLLGGLWHGASWTFVLWGFLHGLYLLIERGLKRCSWPKLFSSTAIQWLFSLMTLLFVVWAFVVFRAENMTQVSEMFRAMFGMQLVDDLLSWDVWMGFVLAAFVTLLLVQWRLRHRLMSDVLMAMPWWCRSALLFVCVVLIILGSGEKDAFIYFQF
ncbi:MBOAT family O-acyltransferase [Marinicella rhabdoformis]|uniref:MBOAT family O-acyltransferase n=1 Tax=Marinicella rhabdoformis TaxID=2580566 RepID=UPI001C556297